MIRLFSFALDSNFCLENQLNTRLIQKHSCTNNQKLTTVEGAWGQCFATSLLVLAIDGDQNYSFCAMKVAVY